MQFSSPDLIFNMKQIFMYVQVLYKQHRDTFMILFLLHWKSHLVMRKHMHYSAHEYKSVFFSHQLTCNGDTASRRETHYIKMLF